MSSIFTLLGQKTKAFVNTQVTALENGAVATNASNISTNTSSIATNASNISTNTATGATNASNISTNTASISSNASNISSNTSSIASEASTARAAEQANASNISTNTSNISTNASNISTNSADISSNTSSISTNASNISTNTSSISTNASNISTNTSSISTNASGISTNQGDISSLQTQAGSLASDGNSASFSGDLGAANMVLTGNLTVQGATTAVQTTNLDVSDSILNLSKGSGDGSNAANDVGFVVERGSSENNVAFVWDEGNDRFTAYEASSGTSFSATDTDLDSTDSSAGFATAQFADVYVNNGGTATNLGTVAEFDAALA